MNRHTPFAKPVRLPALGLVALDLDPALDARIEEGELREAPTASDIIWISLESEAARRKRTA